MLDREGDIGLREGSDVKGIKGVGMEIEPGALSPPYASYSVLAMVESVTNI